MFYDEIARLPDERNNSRRALSSPYRKAARSCGMKRCLRATAIRRLRRSVVVNYETLVPYARRSPMPVMKTRSPQQRTWRNYSQTMKTQRRRSQTGNSVEFWWSDFTARDGSPLPITARKRINWYEKNARFQRKAFYTSEIIVILLSAAIPTAAALGARSAITGVLGALVVVTAGLRQLYRWGENWIRSSQTLVGLQAEIIKWSVGAPPYQSGSDAAAVLVTRLESIVAVETSSWASMLQSAQSQSATAPVSTSRPQ
jgi:hypothetical protein